MKTEGVSPFLNLAASGATVFQVFPTLGAIWERVEHPGIEMDLNVPECCGRKPPNSGDKALLSYSDTGEDHEARRRCWMQHALCDGVTGCAKRVGELVDLAGVAQYCTTFGSVGEVDCSQDRIWTFVTAPSRCPGDETEQRLVVKLWDRRESLPHCSVAAGDHRSLLFRSGSNGFRFSFCVSSSTPAIMLRISTA